MENVFEIPAQTRTLYFNFGRSHEFGGSHHEVVKHKLNLPRLLLKFELTENIIYDFTELAWYLKNFGSHLWTIRAINENNQLCWTPLPNILRYDVICFGNGNYPKNITEFKERFYNSVFSCSGVQHLKYYLTYYSNEIISVFYKNWENTGKLELKLMD